MENLEKWLVNAGRTVLSRRNFTFLIDANCCRIHFGGDLDVEPDRKIKICSVIHLPSLCTEPYKEVACLPTEKKKRNYISLKFYFSFILHYLPFLPYVRWQCLVVQPDSSDLLSGIFMTHGGCCPQSKFSRKIYYTNSHFLVVCKGTCILFCGQLYPLHFFSEW